MCSGTNLELITLAKKEHTNVHPVATRAAESEPGILQGTRAGAQFKI